MAAYSDGTPEGSKTRAQAIKLGISDAAKRKNPKGSGGKFQPPKTPPRGADDPF